MVINQKTYTIMTHQGLEAETEFGVSLNPTGESWSSGYLGIEDLSGAYLMA